MQGTYHARDPRRESASHRDPDRKTLEAFVLRAGTWAPLIACERDGTVRAPPFDAIELDLGALWV